MQNYDDLYADVLLWVNNGWVDYNIPQIYWEIGHPAADLHVLDVNIKIASVNMEAEEQ